MNSTTQTVPTAPWKPTEEAFFSPTELSLIAVIESAHPELKVQARMNIDAILSGKHPSAGSGPDRLGAKAAYLGAHEVRGEDEDGKLTYLIEVMPMCNAPDDQPAESPLAKSVLEAFKKPLVRLYDGRTYTILEINLLFANALVAALGCNEERYVSSGEVDGVQMARVAQVTLDEEGRVTELN